MKKIYLSMITIASVIVTFVAVSCSKDQSLNEGNANSQQQRIANPKLSDLQVEFLEIMQSSDYINLENCIKTITQALNGNKIVPINTKEEFLLWIDSNISNTTFANKEEASDLYDEFLLYSNVYTNKYQLFYKDIEDGEFSNSQIALIFNPELQLPPQNTYSSPCQNYCMDECETNIDFLNAGYTENNGWSTPRGRFQYWITYRWIVLNFNGCMSGC